MVVMITESKAGNTEISLILPCAWQKTNKKRSDIVQIIIKSITPKPIVAISVYLNTIGFKNESYRNIRLLFDEY